MKHTIILLLFSCALWGQVHPTVKNTFYNLPLEKPRKDLREAIINDRRFISKGTASNYLFFGKTLDKGLVKSNPDSIQVLLFLGNTSLTTEKGGKEDFKNIMLLNCKYFYSNKNSIEMEYGRLLNMLHPILKDSSSEKNESSYSIGKVLGHRKTIGKIFESFEPYYRVGLLLTSLIPDNGTKSVFVLEIVFSKEDK